MASHKPQTMEFDKVPLGPLGIISMDGSKELGTLIDNHMVKWRKEYAKASDHVTFPGYLRDSYLISTDCFRFSSGEGKAVVNESVRGHDVYLIADVGNYNCKFKMFGQDCPMSPDDHFQDLKRIISAIGGKARRITVIMPLLYEGRQHRKITRESLDCALALQELERLGVDNIITFDAHDPRVQNAIPLKGFENLYPTYQFIKALLRNETNLNLNKNKMLIISPDEGSMGRCLYYSSMLGLNLGLFYKRRDYSKIVNGRNPIIKHEFLGDSVEGKDILIVDDLLASGESVLDIAHELKRRKARNIYVIVTFALFTDGIEEFNQAYEKGIIKKVFSTNLTYRRESVLQAPWYLDVDMSKFIAYLIDTLNHDQSISHLINPLDRIQALLEGHNSPPLD